MTADMGRLGSKVRPIAPLKVQTFGDTTFMGWKRPRSIQLLRGGHRECESGSRAGEFENDPSVIQATDGSIHLTYSYSVPEGKSIKHVEAFDGKPVAPDEVNALFLASWDVVRT